MKPRTTIETRRIHIYTYTRMCNTDVQMDEGDGTRRGRKRTAWRARRRIGREVAGDEGDDGKKRERGCTICMYVRVRAYAYYWVRVRRASAGTTESTRGT